jgi:hypothetical protein
VTIIRLEVEVAPSARGISSRGRHDAASGVALVALLDFDHLGAQVGEHHGRHRSLLPDRPIENPDSFEWAFHEADVYHNVA